MVLLEGEELGGSGRGLREVTVSATASNLLAMASKGVLGNWEPLFTKGSLSYLSSPCFSKNVLQSGVGIVH